MLTAVGSLTLLAVVAGVPVCHVTVAPLGRLVAVIAVIKLTVAVGQALARLMGQAVMAVSYTHLDVYKRQVLDYVYVIHYYRLLVLLYLCEKLYGKGKIESLP